MEDFKELRYAIFGEGRQYRYILSRQWDLTRSQVLFIGLNPSTANEHKNDPTITNVMKLADNNGYGGIWMMNLFGIVSSKPNILKSHANPIGENDHWLHKMQQQCVPVVFAWGNFKVAEERAKKVIAMFPDAYCIGKNKNGTPWHPLFKKSTIQFFKY